MALPWKPVALAAALFVAGLGAFVASSVGEDPSTEIGREVAGSYAPVKTASGPELRRVSAARLGLASEGADGKQAGKLSYFVTVDPVVVAPAGQPESASLFAIRCPARQQPVTGGVLAPQPGLSVTNSSRTNPVGKTVARAWYEGVVNFTSSPLEWKPFLTCLSR